mgnify:FL=1
MFVLNGEPALIRVMADRKAGHLAHGLMDVDWNPMNPLRKPSPWQHEATLQQAREVPKPSQLPRLLSVSRQLAGTLPFVSVDAYLLLDDVYIGELTFSPAGGALPFPYAFDRALGNRFQLPDRA